MSLYKFLFRMPGKKFKRKYPIAYMIRAIISSTIVFTSIALYLIGAGAAEQAPPGTTMLQLMLIGSKPIITGTLLFLIWAHANKI